MELPKIIKTEIADDKTIKWLLELNDENKNLKRNKKFEIETKPVEGMFHYWTTYEVIKDMFLLWDGMFFSVYFYFIFAIFFFNQRLRLTI